jgi:transglutaminase-like putative cysteine protease
LAENGLRRPLLNPMARVRRLEKLVTLALLMILLASAAGVTSLLISPGWSSLWKGLLFGLLAGWALAVLQQPALRSALISLAAGIIFTLLFSGGLANKVVLAAAELLRIFGLILALPKGAVIDLAPLSRLLLEIPASTGVLVERIRSWALALTSGQPGYDPVAASLVWGLLFWLIAAWAGWIVERRQNALLAALPALLLSTSLLSYGRRDSPVLYLMLGATLVLVATVQHDRREQGWDDSGVAYPSWKGRQIGTAAIIVSAVLVLLAAFTSSLSLERVSQWLRLFRTPASRQDSALAESLGITPATAASPDSFESVRRPGLPQEHLIGSGPELSERMVMSVAVDNLQALSQAGQSPPLYWRSFAYDVYTGSGWRSSGTEQEVYQANQPLQADHSPDHIQVQEVVRPVEELGGFVYAPGDPVMVNSQSEVAWRSPGDLFGIQIGALGPYQVLSLVPVVDESTLRAAGQRYPDWVRQRFLALPAEVPDRVKALAVELTASEPTPYDRARAIERYLRTIPYTLDVNRPPSNQDLVDFFLFDLRKGYCDYYASAMVVLARAAGVPARLATGFASGTYNLNSKRFMVSEADAHSWAEIYFPGIGWVPFEPTAARPLLERSPRPTPESPHLTASSQQTPGPGWVGSFSWIWVLLIAGLGAAVVLATAWAILDGIRLRQLSKEAAAAEVYRRMRRTSARFALTPEPGDTPYEFAALWSLKLRDLPLSKTRKDFWEDTGLEIHAIIDRIVYTSYHPSQLKATRETSLLRQWRALRWRLRWVWILKSWESMCEHIRRTWVGLGGN